jgi:carbonic anhydrase
MSDIKTLLDGYRRFYSRHFLRRDPLFTQLAANGQAPKTLVIACSDSRVDPAIVMDADPGDMFVVRNVASLVPPFAADSGHHGTSAALEFAVCNLKVQHIIVCGHSGCAGINALLHDTCGHDEESFIGRWVDIARKAREHTLHACGGTNHPGAGQMCEEQAILTSLQNLMTFPWIRVRAEAGELTLHGWYFNLNTGALSAWEEAEKRFLPIALEL